MLLLPYFPFLWRSFLELDWPNKVACVGALFFLGTMAGIFLWGIEFAFAIALVLAPVMLATICVIAGASSVEES